LAAQPGLRYDGCFDSSLATRLCRAVLPAAQTGRTMGVIFMKTGIHPDYHEITVACACGSTFKTRTTFKGNLLRLEICSNCHPFYTGKQKLIDTAGRVERFNKKYAAVKKA
jgi:large subunit ribosomal protein L31